MLQVNYPDSGSSEINSSVNKTKQKQSRLREQGVAGSEPKN